MQNLVSVIIINYNTFDLTAACIKSILQYTKGIAYEIIVVDNASPNDDPDKFIQLFPSVKLVKSNVNGGFAAGNNLGIDQSSGNIILLLNSDTYLEEDSISKTAAFLANLQLPGPVSCCLNYENGRYQHNIRKFRSIRNELLDIARPVLYLMPYRQRALLMLNQYFKGDFDTQCDWISGAFMMFFKEALQKLPGQKLDERFFMYGEDQLWCYQFKKAGFPSWCFSGTALVHIGNASTSADKRLKLLKTGIKRDLEIMAYRKGKGLYYYLFYMVYKPKLFLTYYLITFFSTLRGEYKQAHSHSIS